MMDLFNLQESLARKHAANTLSSVKI